VLALLALCVASLTAQVACAQSAPEAKQLRRLQMQLQNAQQQLQEAQAAKAKVEADKAAADKAAADLARLSGALKGQLRKAGEELKSAEAERSRLTTAVAGLEQQVVEQKRASEDALAQKGRELAQFTRVRDEQQAQLQRRHDEQLALVGECSARNTRLIQLSAELLDRYRNKSVSDVLKQRDVVLGLGDVQMFNLVQSYRDKADAERFVPSSNR
jgi:chromosome segregation ATPase